LETRDDERGDACEPAEPKLRELVFGEALGEVGGEGGAEIGESLGDGADEGELG
jgi:hypothetical protein